MTDDSTPTEVFVAYADDDREFYIAFHNAMNTLCTEKNVMLHHHQEILAGKNKLSEIEARLNSAAFVFLFISTRFLASSYWHEQIEPSLSKRYTATSQYTGVVVIVLTACDWEETRLGNLTLDDLQQLPRNRMYIEDKDNDEAWKEVVSELRALISTRANQSAPTDQPNLPTGSVTFMMTDVVGNTKMWNRSKERMDTAMRRHDQLAQAIVIEHNGIWFKPRGEGDSLFLVFANPIDAALAACDFQRVFYDEPWPEGLEVRIRIALHTGEAQPQDNDYRGPTPNKCGRLRSMAHGQQILLSKQTRSQLLGLLPPDISMIGLGRYRLKGFDEPEYIYQLNPAGLPSRFAPLEGRYELPALPVYWTGFVGRETDRDNIISLLDTSRLLTITGPTGIGKTRLVAQILKQPQLVESYEIAFIQLEGQSDFDLALTTAFGVSPHPSQKPAEALAEEIERRPMLLVLDQFEHLPASSKTLIHYLLLCCPNLKIIVTSQVTLSLGEERFIRLEPLALTEMAMIFEQQAQFHRPSIEFTEQDRIVVERICGRLDGIPLAVELVAAWVRDGAVSLTQLESYLASGMISELTTLIERSCLMLSPLARLLLQRLSVFTGTFVLTAIESVCKDDGLMEMERIELLRELVTRSLLLVESKRGSELRYRLLEPVRNFIIKQPGLAVQRDTLCRRHLEYFVAWAEQTRECLFETDQAQFLDLMELEHSNLSAALDWCQSSGGQVEAQLRLVCVLWWFWKVRGHLTEGRQRLLNAVTVGKGGELSKLRKSRGLTRYVAVALHGLGEIAFSQGDYTTAQVAWEQSLELARSRKDREFQAKTLYNLGDIYHNKNDYPKAREFVQDSLAIFEELNNRFGISEAQTRLGYLAYCQGEYKTARQWYMKASKNAEDHRHMRGVAVALTMLGNLACRAEGSNELLVAERYHNQSRSIFRTLGDSRGEAQVLCGLGHVRRADGDYTGAQGCYEQSLSLFRAVKDGLGEAIALNALGSVARLRNDFSQARQHHEESLAIFQRLEDTRRAAYAMVELGRCALMQQHYRTARNWFTQALPKFEQVGDQRGYIVVLEGMTYYWWREQGDAYRAMVFYEVTQNERRRLGIFRSSYTLDQQSLCEGLSEEQFNAAWEESRNLTLADVIEQAIS